MTNVNRYYDETLQDCNRALGTRKHLGLHYGYNDFKTDGYYYHDRAVTRMNEVLANRAKITSKDIVLDAGCGIGGSALWLAENIGCRVHGINVNPKQVRIAEDAAIVRNLENKVNFRVGSYDDIIFIDEMFDVVWFLESFNYSKNPALTLAEAHRILVPGGRIIIAGSFLLKDIQYLSENEQYLIEEWEHGWAVPGHTAIDKIGNILTNYTFTNVMYEDITEQVMTSSVKLHDKAMVAYPFLKFAEMLGLRSRVQNDNVKSAILQYKVFASGIGRYGIFTALKK